MSGQLRTLKNRIRSISNTKKITRAMEMVAASKLKKYQNMVLEGTPYANGLMSILQRVAATGATSSHPLLEKREEKKKAVLLLTSDTGLCGSYNEDIVDEAIRLIEGENEAPLLIGVGKLGINALKKSGYKFHKTFIETKTNEIESTIVELREILIDLYSSGTIDSLHVVYSHFISSARFEPIAEKLLPFEVDLKTNENKGNEGDASSESEEKYILDPSPEVLFQKLIPAVFSTKTRSVFLEAFVSEQMARMNAMHMATENASDLIDELVLARNKARQAAITKELIEIVSGSQAAKS